MDNLDNLDQMKIVDSMNMAGAIFALPEQCEEAKRIAEAADIPSGFGPFASVIILGLGGSAIGGDLVRARYEDVLPIPVSVNRDYTLPAYAGKDTLVVASSYSGNTEETLSAYNEAIARGCATVAITTGGKLLELAEKNGTPAIKIPGGLQPRAAIGVSFVPLLILFNRLGLVDVRDTDFEEMVDVLRTMRDEMKPERDSKENFAKQLSRRVYGKIPVVYGSQGWKGVVAYRWKCQFNENSKNICYSNVFPELNHNEIVGTEAPQDLLSETEVIILREQDEMKQIDRRLAVTSEIMKRCGIGVTEVCARGESSLAQLFSLIYVGDYVTFYLAILNRIDPSPVEAIAYLKRQLAKA
jgi:glucose/mannose-6-phosphate isomerase